MLESFIRTLGIFPLLWVAIFPVSSFGTSVGEIQDRRESLVPEPIFNGRVYVQEAGRHHSKTVVLIHGLGTSASRDWEEIFPELAQKFHVLAFDLPGFGQSDAGNDLYSPSRYAELMDFLLPQFAKGPVHLVGHSMGGAIALCYAAEHPRNVSRLILASVPGILHRQVYSRFLAQSGSRLLPDIFPQQDAFLDRIAETVLRRAAGKPIPDAWILFTSLTREKFLQADPVRIAAFATAVEDFSPLIGRIITPTLILWGTQDSIASPRTATLLASQIPNARLKWMKGAGHVLMKEQPKEFAGTLLAFLREPDKSLSITQVTETAGSFAAISKGTGRCQDQSCTVFEGSYDAIEITNCRSVLLKNVRTPSVRILESSVIIENSHIGPNKTALSACRSEIVLTGGRIEGEIAVNSEESRLDFAGVTIVGKEAAVKVLASEDPRSGRSVPAALFFSVCPIQSPRYSGYLHGARVILPDRPL